MKKDTAPPTQGTPAAAGQQAVAGQQATATGSAGQGAPVQLPQDPLQEPAADPWRAPEQTAGATATPALPPGFAAGPGVHSAQLPVCKALRHKDIEKPM